jgi:membrane protease YdiL (CAAX protease family)
MALASGGGFAALAALQGHSVQQAMAFANDASSDEGKIYNLIINGVNQLLSFGLMAWCAQKLFAGRTFLNLSFPQSSWWLCAFALAWAVQPLIDLTFRINGMLLEFLPDALVQSINHYEAVAAKVTASLLTFDAAWQFPATLITVALLPAICEEFAFRGIIQPLTARWTNNIHAGVWMGAFLFSAIHLQFQGFLPRMIIGAGLGYLVVFSGSLWPAIAAHFFNNAGAIVMAAIYGEAFIQEEMNASSAWELGDYGFAVVALAIGVFGIRWIRSNSQWPERHPVC